MLFIFHVKCWEKCMCDSQRCFEPASYLGFIKWGSGWTARVMEALQGLLHTLCIPSAPCFELMESNDFLERTLSAFLLLLALSEPKGHHLFAPLNVGKEHSVSRSLSVTLLLRWLVVGLDGQGAGLSQDRSLKCSWGPLLVCFTAHSTLIPNASPWEM